VTLKVIGAGFGRTGTLSLKLALERLGLEKCYHMLEVMQNEGHAAVWRAAARGESVGWDGLFAGYQASVDWPSCNFWEAQLQHFADAKVSCPARAGGSVDPRAHGHGVRGDLGWSVRRAHG
jgi:hypothetical protein